MGDTIFRVFIKLGKCFVILMLHEKWIIAKTIAAALLIADKSLTYACDTMRIASFGRDKS